jgi:putative holliday junction resolvase
MFRPLFDPSGMHEESHLGSDLKVIAVTFCRTYSYEDPISEPLKNPIPRNDDGNRKPEAGSRTPKALYNSTVTPASVSTSHRVLGLDVGARRIGLAVSDPLGITAQGLETLHRKNKKYDFSYLHRVIREYDVQEIVVGLPLRMSGAEGIQADKIQSFASDLRKHFKLPVHLWDERLTSAEANRLLRETDLSIEKRGQAVDRMAAILILQGWMEHRGAQ